MQIIRGLQNIKKPVAGCVVTLGNFDGIHRGHQQLIAHLQQVAAQKKLPAILIVMEPHPQEYFLGHNAPARLTRFREKIEILQHLAVENVLCLRFNSQFAQLGAAEFIRSLLVDALNVKQVVVGDDFRFGQGRQGDFQLLTDLGQQYGFAVSGLGSVYWQGQRVSSTQIRQLLQHGNVELAAEGLGRNYSMCGRVAYGEARGRQWGIPTANILLRRKVIPLHGVFAVQVQGIGKKLLQGVANVGQRPTVNGQRCLLEVHLFNFDATIYCQYLKVEFIHKLRDEQRFASIEQLRQQIEADIKAAKAYFRNGRKQHDRL